MLNPSNSTSKTVSVVFPSYNAYLRLKLLTKLRDCTIGQTIDFLVEKKLRHRRKA